MKYFSKLLVLILCLFILTGTAFTGEILMGTFYSAIDQDGTVCGYIKADVSEIEADGRKAVQIVQHIEMEFAALGANVETKIDTKTLVDKKSGMFFFSEFDANQGTVILGGSAVIDGDTAIMISRPEEDTTKVFLPEGVLLENSHYFPHLVRDFIESDLEEKRYKALDLMDSEIHEVTYKKIGVEELELAGNKYKAMVFRKIDQTTGLKIEQYINMDNGCALKTVLPSRMTYLADESVVEEMARVSIDDKIIARVGVAIPDYKGISYMKAEALLEPGGLWISEESLNIPGQKFEGTVKDNLVEGVFEVSHDKYDGSNAPAFPTDYSGDPSLKEYLEPEEFIEADDPVLIEEAERITDGATDSWDAFRRLSKWVAEEIGYDIPGGGGARNTYDLRLGECGSHSRLLAAFSRAVGIPCRVVWGCMYVPDMGGGFGQHGWNEVYMGEAGWIPVDATAKEIDYVDSGHLRIGVLSSLNTFLNPKKMKIIDYKIGTGSESESADDADKYERYIGEYEGPGKNFTVLVQNNSLAVDIPGKMVFELRDPDEDGRWVFKLTDMASISFWENEDSEVTGMTLLSLTKLPRKKSAEETEVDYTDVPEEFQAYLGKYVVPMQNMDLTVIYQDSNLAVDDPNEGIIQLKGPDEKGEWIDQFDKNKISFDLDEEGPARNMIVHNIVKLPRIE